MVPPRFPFAPLLPTPVFAFPPLGFAARIVPPVVPITPMLTPSPLAMTPGTVIVVGHGRADAPEE